MVDIGNGIEAAIKALVVMAVLAGMIIGVIGAVVVLRYLT